MSRQRNEILPGAGGWDSFYDKHVQAVLEPHRTVPACDKPSEGIPAEARLEFLAWPIIAYNIVNDLVQELDTKMDRHRSFLDAYAANRRMVSHLLCVLTEYHLMDESEKPLPRRVAEVSNLCSSKSMAEYFRPAAIGIKPIKRPQLALHDWKTIQTILGCRNSSTQLKTEFHREKERRKRIRARWAANFKAWNELETLRLDARERLLPLQKVIVAD